MKASVGLSALAVLGGIWIGIAPFWVGYAPKHGPVFTGPVAVSVWMGGLISVVGLIGLVGFWAGGLGEWERNLRAQGQVPAYHPEPGTSGFDPRSSAGAQTSWVEPTVAAETVQPAPEDLDTDARLQALVDRVLKDHSLAGEKPTQMR